MNDPWFRLHANIGDRNVVARLMRFANLDQARAVGYLAMFWGKLSQHGSNGDISETTDVQIEQWASWRGKRGVFAKFIREHHSTDGVVNEYDDYCSVLETLRARDRARKAIKNPPRKSRNNSTGIPPESKRKRDGNSEGNSAGNPREFRGNSVSTIRNEDDTKKEQPPAGREADASAGGGNPPVQKIESGPKPKPASWPAEAAADHEEITNGVIGIAKLGKILKPLVDKHGWPAVRPAWREFLASEESRFAANWFVENYGRYGNVKGTAKVTDSYALKLIDFFAKNGFSQNLSMADHDNRIDEMAASGAVKDAERLKRELRLVEPWLTFRSLRVGEEKKLVPMVKERLAA